MEKDDQVKQELIRSERAFGEAITRRDTGTLDQFLADDFVVINNLGQVLNKTQVLADIKSSDYEIESLRNEDINVRLFGEVAVATARGVVKGRYKGKDASGQFRYTRIWVKRQNHWQAVAAQSTSIPRS